MSEPLTLALDASTYVGTVAVLRGRDVLVEAEAQMRGEREERLMPAVANALAAAGVEAAELNRVVCGAGPGSFTSLRIAASIAKGIALVSNAPLFAVSSLGLIVASRRRARGRYLAVLDAMRGDVHAAVVEVDEEGDVCAVQAPSLIPLASVDHAASSAMAAVAGAGRVVEGAPHARGVSRMAALVDGARVSLESWEPDYGRLAEAQVKWEAAHGRALPTQ
jgi:tRNA threonylcarbamoyladenosine biosynthesis protein TsaB